MPDRAIRAMHAASRPASRPPMQGRATSACSRNERFRAAPARRIIGTARPGAGRLDEMVCTLRVLVHKRAAIAALDHMVICSLSCKGLHVPELGTTRQRE